MKKLTTRDYWDTRYAGKITSSSTIWRRWCEKLRQSQPLRELIRAQNSYDDYILWTQFYSFAFSDSRGAKVIEVGSAPGHHLIALNRAFGCDVYGVEYAENGAELNRRAFKENGIPGENVIQADFFSEDFMNTNEGRYDVVLSRGFIEHFSDPVAVVKRHLRLLRPGGRLVISVPRYRGVYHLWARFFARDSLAAHNLAIMKLDAFRQLFQCAELSIDLCAYYGTFNLYRFNTRLPGLRQFMLVVVQLQRLLNILFRLAFGTRGAESAWFSPFLICVATRIK